jgi:uncharacterized membrane protein (DUF106 family)
MAFETLLNPILNPLLDSIGYFWTLTILVIIITFIITIIYKYTTNQSLMKDLKGELKEFQKQIKELRSEPEKAMQVQKRMMETNTKYMMHSFKPMIFTFLPIIIFFGWMHAHLAYYPILPGEEFSVTMEFKDKITGNVVLELSEGLTPVNDLNQTIQLGEATWVLKGELGEYLLTYNYNGVTYTNEILVTNDKTYKQPITKIKKGLVKSINTNLEKVLLLPVGFTTFGWLGTYILFSIIGSMLLRKLMKIY